MKIDTVSTVRAIEFIYTPFDHLETDYRGYFVFIAWQKLAACFFNKLFFLLDDPRRSLKKN
ncbi:MAG: hypothetical protein ABSG48_08675 [Geobacteraceae bacterium]|jgi:hypothetical protein